MPYKRANFQRVVEDLAAYVHDYSADQRLKGEAFDLSASTLVCELYSPSGVMAFCGHLTDELQARYGSLRAEPVTDRGARMMAWLDDAIDGFVVRPGAPPAHGADRHDVEAYEADSVYFRINGASISFGVQMSLHTLEACRERVRHDDALLDLVYARSGARSAQLRTIAAKLDEAALRGDRPLLRPLISAALEALEESDFSEYHTEPRKRQRIESRRKRVAVIDQVHGQLAALCTELGLEWPGPQSPKQQ